MSAEQKPPEPEIPDTRAMLERRVKDLESDLENERREKKRLEDGNRELREKLGHVSSDDFLPEAEDLF